MSSLNDSGLSSPLLHYSDWYLKKSNKNNLLSGLNKIIWLFLHSNFNLVGQWNWLKNSYTENNFLANKQILPMKTHTLNVDHNITWQSLNIHWEQRKNSLFQCFVATLIVISYKENFDFWCRDKSCDRAPNKRTSLNLFCVLCVVCSKYRVSWFHWLNKPTQSITCNHRL